MQSQRLQCALLWITKAVVCFRSKGLCEGYFYSISCALLGEPCEVEKCLQESRELIVAPRYPFFSWGCPSSVLSDVMREKGCLDTVPMALALVVLAGLFWATAQAGGAL